MWKPGETYKKRFVVVSPTNGNLVDADELPSAYAERNLVTDEDFALVVTKVSTGKYNCQGVIPAGYTPGDMITISVNATINGLTGDGWPIDEFEIVAFRWSDLPTEVWKVLTVGLTLAGSIGKYILDSISAIIASIAEIKAKTDNVPDSPAAVSDIPTPAEIDAELTGAHGADSWQGGGSSETQIVSLPVFKGSVYSLLSKQSLEVEIVQGNTPRIKFEFEGNWQGWTPYFAAKSNLSDDDYIIGPVEGTWESQDAESSAGYVDLTAEHTATLGTLYGEIQLRNNTTQKVQTAILFMPVIIQGVIG